MQKGDQSAVVDLVAISAMHGSESFTTTTLDIMDVKNTDEIFSHARTTAKFKFPLKNLHVYCAHVCRRATEIAEYHDWDSECIKLVAELTSTSFIKYESKIYCRQWS